MPTATTPTRPGASPLDESPAVVSGLLAVWAGLLAAGVIAAGGWDDPRLLRNGCIRLMTLGVTAAAIGWSLHSTRLGLAKRMRFGAAVSLLLHSLLAVALAWVGPLWATRPSPAPPRPEATASPAAPGLVARVSRSSADDRPPFDRPVEAGSPAAPPSAATVSRDATRIATSTRAGPAPDRETAQPAMLSLRLPRPQTTPARRDHEAGRWSAAAGRAALAAAPAPPLAKTSAPPRSSRAAVAPPPLAKAPARPLPADPPREGNDAPRTDRTPPTMAIDGLSTEAFSPRAVVAATRTQMAATLPNPLAAPPEMAPVGGVPDQIDAGRPIPRNLGKRRAQLMATGPSAREWASAASSPSAAPGPLALRLPPRDRRASNAERGAISAPRQPLADPPPDLSGRLAGGAPVAPASRRRADLFGDMAEPGGPATALPLPGGSTGGRAEPPPRARAGAALAVAPPVPPPREESTRSGWAPAPPTSGKGPRPLVASGLWANPLPRRSPPSVTRPASRTPEGLAPPPVEAPPPPRVSLAAPAGKGGLASASARSLGLPEAFPPRLARIAPDAGASTRRRLGGSRSGPATQRRPAAAFSARGRRLRTERGGAAGRPASPNEAAIELGLRFLARLQAPDGRWAFARTAGLTFPAGEAPTVQADAAATGLALLAFLGAGYDHYGGAYGPLVGDGLDYLVARQRADGALFPEDAPGASPWQVARYYSHGIGTIALCEAYGMTGDRSLLRPAQRALDYIARSQTPMLGGWRYVPGAGSDLSVTGWQMMALRSGQLAGLRVEPRSLEGVERFVERCREANGQRARFCYNPTASATNPRTRHGRGPGTVMTSVGLLMRLHLGEPPESPRVKAAADHLLANLPTVGQGTRPAATSTLGNPLRDTYYWYYATQAMYQMRGDYWQAWGESLMPMLVESQLSAGPLAGSWDPRRPTPDKWSAYGGRLYVTAMNLLSLEVSYRHLPIYRPGAGP